MLGGASPLFELMPVLIGDRIAPVLAKAARRDTDPDRRLAPLVFADTQQINYALDVGAAVACGLYFARTPIVLDIGFHYGIEHRVRRQTVLVGLIRPQFGRTRCPDKPLRYLH